MRKVKWLVVGLVGMLAYSALANNTNMVNTVSNGVALVEQANEVLSDTPFKDMGVEMLLSIKGFCESSVDFVKEETPKLVKEFLHWNFALSLLKFCWHIIWIILLFLGGKKCVEVWMNEEKYPSVHASWEIGAYSNEPPAQWVLALICTIIIGVLSLITVIFTLTEGFNIDWVQIWVAPRVYLIEYITPILQGIGK